MTDPCEALIADLVQWLATAPQPYRTVMEAWRTSCPRLPVWEEAVERGYVALGADAMVTTTPVGIDYLAQIGRR